jgi:aminopeptidase N
MSATSNTKEQSSLSSYVLQRATHLHLDWNVDFSARKISGTVTTEFVVAEEAASVTLDTNHLEIHAVTVNGLSALLSSVQSRRPLVYSTSGVSFYD